MATHEPCSARRPDGRGSHSASARRPAVSVQLPHAFAFALLLSVARRVSGRCSPRTVFVAVKRIGVGCAPCKATCLLVTRTETSAWLGAEQSSPLFMGVGGIDNQDFTNSWMVCGPAVRAKLTLHYGNRRGTWRNGGVPPCKKSRARPTRQWGCDACVRVVAIGPICHARVAIDTAQRRLTPTWGCPLPSCDANNRGSQPLLQNARVGLKAARQGAARRSRAVTPTEPR